jgi:hypothetical protein
MSNEMTMSEQPEWSKNKGGRPKGSLTPGSKASIAKLRQLGFDPIEALVHQYNKVQEELAEMETLKTRPRVYTDGTTQRFSSMAYANLLTVSTKLAADLLRYGYARVPETVNVETRELPQLTINLTKKGDTYIPAELENVIAIDEEEGDDE